METPLPRTNPRGLALLTSALLCLGAGCTIGPTTIPADRFNYSEAVAQSFKQQLLLNIVRLRYADLPVFVEVDNIVSSYSLESTIGAGLNPYDATDTLDLQGEVIFEERPTISYRVLAGSDFAVALLQPIPIATIWSLIESGWNAERLLRGMAQSIGDVHNRLPTSDEPTAADPQFSELVAAIRRLQLHNAIGVRVVEEQGRPARTAFYLRRGAAVDESAETVRRILELPEDVEEVVLLYDAQDVPGSLRFRTRSLLQVLLDVASDIEAPAEHVQRGIVSPPRDAADPLMRIRSGPARPRDSFCAVRYRDSWFWIDQEDLRSKQTFAFLGLVFRVKAGDTRGDEPVLTIPTR